MKQNSGRCAAAALGLLFAGRVKGAEVAGGSAGQPWSITTPWRSSSSGSPWKLEFDGKPFDGAGVRPTGGLDLLDTDKAHLAIFGRLQMMGVGENVPDGIRRNNRIYLFLNEARLGFRGNYQGYKFELQSRMGGEEALGSDAVQALLDAAVDAPVPAGDDTSIKIGQFRIPYGREGLTDTGYTAFNDRSIQSMGFYMGRDYGLAVQSYQGEFAGTVGVFSGGGVDVPSHYIPEALGLPMVAVRLGYNDGADADIYHVVQTDLNLKRTVRAVYVNALFMKDSSVGHSTLLNVRDDTDQNLLTNPNWNPYLGAGGSGVYPPGPAGFGAGDLFLLGGDAVCRAPFGEDKALDLEGEADWGGYQNQFGRLHEASGRVQAGYLFKPFELALRYAALFPDKNFGSGVGKIALGARPIHQIDPALTWYMKGQNVKLVFDTPVYLNMPVITEPFTGSYVLSDFPSAINASNLVNAPWDLSRRTVTEARMMFQFMF